MPTTLHGLFETTILLGHSLGIGKVTCISIGTWDNNWNARSPKFGKCNKGFE